jgi:hypothetical protein
VPRGRSVSIPIVTGSIVVRTTDALAWVGAGDRGLATPDADAGPPPNDARSMIPGWVSDARELTVIQPRDIGDLVEVNAPRIGPIRLMG